MCGINLNWINKLNFLTGLNLLKKGTLAFNTDGIYAYAILKSIPLIHRLISFIRKKFHFVSITHRQWDLWLQVHKIPTGPGVPRKSPLKEIITIGVRKVRETGILSCIWTTWISHMPKYAGSNVEVIPIDILHFSSALYVLGFGIQISISILIVEIFVNYNNYYWKARNNMLYKKEKTLSKWVI